MLHRPVNKLTSSTWQTLYVQWVLRIPTMNTILKRGIKKQNKNYEMLHIQGDAEEMHVFKWLVFCKQELVYNVFFLESSTLSVER